MLLNTPAEKCVPIHQRANKKSAKEEKEKEITISKKVLNHYPIKLICRKITIMICNNLIKIKL
jgi:hypothetical protein